MKSKGWTRMAFEHAMRLTPVECLCDKHGHYVDPMVQRMWSAFKAGTDYTPNRGTFVIAEIHKSEPHFLPEIFQFKDQARNTQAVLASQSGILHAVFQQISSFNPVRNSANDDGSA